MKYRILLLALLAVPRGGSGQTAVDLRTQTKNHNLAAAPFTRTLKTDVVLPATCTPGDLFFKTDAAPGRNLYGCTSENVWTLQNVPANLSGITGVEGTGTLLQIFGGGAVSANDCAKFDANGNLISAGKECGTATPGGSSGQIQINSGGSLAGRWVGTGLSMDEASLAIDSAVVPQKGTANTFTQPNTFLSSLTASGSSSSVDFSTANSTAPIKTGTTPPAACAAGKELYLDTDASPGGRLLICNSTGDGWTGLDELGGSVYAGTAGQLGYYAGDGTSISGAGCEYADNKLTCPAGFEAGDGTAAGEVQLPEKAVNGGEYISLKAPDAIPSTLTLVLPAGSPAGQVVSFAAPAAGVSQGSWITPVETSRAVNTSAPLSGGGALSGDLTLSCPTCVTGSRAIETAPDSGLTGGGDLSADRSLAVAGNLRVSTLGITIDGGGSAITAGVKGYLRVPFACTIQDAMVLADQPGSIVIDVWKDTYANFPPTAADSITAAARPALSAAQKSLDTTLAGWATAVNADDILAFNVESASTVTRVHLVLKCAR